MYAHLRDKALEKDCRERSLSEHLAISRAERPDEWEMDEFIKQALALEDRLLRLEGEVSEERILPDQHTPIGRCSECGEVIDGEDLFESEDCPSEFVNIVNEHFEELL